MKTLVVRTCQAAMNRRTGRLAAVVVVLVALSSSAACGSDNTKTVDRGATSGPISTPSRPISSSTMPGSPSTNPTNSSGTPSRLTPDPTYLVDLKAVAGYTSGTGQTKVNAHDYLRSITLNVSGGTESIEYDLKAMELLPGRSRFAGRRSRRRPNDFPSLHGQPATRIRDQHHAGPPQGYARACSRCSASQVGGDPDIGGMVQCRVGRCSAHERCNAEASALARAARKNGVLRRHEDQMAQSFFCLRNYCGNARSGMRFCTK